jgi:hypothetical protein
MIRLPLVDMSLGQIHVHQKGCTPDPNRVLLYHWYPFCLVGQLLKVLSFSRANTREEIVILQNIHVTLPLVIDALVYFC